MRKSKKPLREGSKLDLPTILEAAFFVLNSHGLEGLSLRAVADRLSVHSPALYWHIENRAALLMIMARNLMDAALLSEREAQNWPEMLIQFARGLRTGLLKHADSARLCLAARPMGRPEDSAEKLAQPLVSKGLSNDHALSYQAAVTAYTVGWVGYEQSDGLHEFLTQIIDFDVSFERGLTAMVSGFETEQAGLLIRLRPPSGRTATRLQRPIKSDKVQCE
jgi:TetR/AcrR family tetracycline transcriptional repressor